jgi:hypothetical protein
MMMDNIFQLMGIIGTIFWIWMVVDCIRNPRLRGAGKVLWLLMIFFLNWIGAVIYFFAGRQRSANVIYMPPRTQQYQPYTNPYMQRNPSPAPPIYQPPAPASESYREYQQGYEAPPEARQQQEEASGWKNYEQPQASYPQIPQQELPPQSQ